MRPCLEGNAAKGLEFLLVRQRIGKGRVPRIRKIAEGEKPPPGHWSLGGKPVGGEDHDLPRLRNRIVIGQAEPVPFQVGT